MNYEVVIGLEMHVELNTKTKITEKERETNSTDEYRWNYPQQDITNRIQQ